MTINQQGARAEVGYQTGPLGAKGPFSRFVARLSALPYATKLLIGLLFIAVTVAADGFTKADVFFTLFYLIPAAYGVWCIGPRTGIAFALVSASTWLALEIFRRVPEGRTALFYWNMGGEILTIACLTTIMVSLRHSLDREYAFARTDPLTKVANRRAFYEAAAVELSRLERYHRPLTVAFVDLDNFKAVNDRLGHTMGDMLLATVASVLKAGIRPVDVIARLGGDEFGLLLADTDAATVHGILERLHASLSVAMEKRQVPVTLSMGAVTYVAMPKNVDEMIARADRSMYAVKRRGKNNVFHEVIDEQTQSVSSVA